MSDRLSEPFMSESEKARLSVTALADRPNESSTRYGKKGMSAGELKAAFSALPCAIADKLNALVTQLNGVISQIDGESGALSRELAELCDKCFGGAGETDGGVGFYSVSGRLLYELALASEICEVSSPPSAQAVKRYVDAETAKKLDAVTTEATYDRVYKVSTSGVQGTLSLDRAASAIDPKWGSVPRRYVQGAIYLPEIAKIPSSKRYRCAMRKDDVDALVDPLCRRIEELESAASGNIYETVTDSGAASEKYIVGDALPYGILSRVGGRSYTVWQESTELSCAYGNTQDDGVLLDAAQLASLFDVGSRFKITAECDDEEALSGTSFTLSYFSIPIDSCGAITFGLDEEVTIPQDADLGSCYYGNQLVVCVNSEYEPDTDAGTVLSFTLHTSPREAPTAVTAVKLYGKNIADISLATAHSSGSVSVEGDSLIWSAGSKYYVELPLSIPSGSTVTASCVCEGAEGDRIEKVTFVTASGEEMTTKLGTAITLHADAAKVRFCKYSQSSALVSDMRISELQVEYGDRASSYVPYAGEEPLAVLEIPEGVTGLEDYGHGTETLYNYLDLGEGKYYRYVDAESQALSEPQVTDVADLLGEDADILALDGVGRVVFESAQGGEVPSVLSYKRKL